MNLAPDLTPILFQNIRFDHLVKGLGVRNVFVLWRRDTLASIVSLLIAQKTGKF
jgi:hypothetical protein